MPVKHVGRWCHERLPSSVQSQRRIREMGLTTNDDRDAPLPSLRTQLDESEKLEEDARNLMLFEWARELLLEDEA